LRRVVPHSFEKLALTFGEQSTARAPTPPPERAAFAAAGTSSVLISIFSGWVSSVKTVPAGGRYCSPTAGSAAKTRRSSSGTSSSVECAG
jgi:hypothetical protein